MQGIAHQESSTWTTAPLTSLHEQLRMMQISATIFCLRTGFWLVSCADALWQGARWLVLHRRVTCHVKDQDNLVQQA